MKLPSTLSILGVVAGLGAASVVLAEEAPPAEVTTPETPAVEEPATDASDKETPPADETVTDPGTPGDDEVIADEGGEVPIDWVIRDADGDPNVIFYNMAGGGEQPSGPATSPVARDEAGKDEAATATEAKTVAPVAPVVREKKGPVALVKGARVFLRH